MRNFEYLVNPKKNMDNFNAVNFVADLYFELFQKFFYCIEIMDEKYQKIIKKIIEINKKGSGNNINTFYFMIERP